jgi:carbonic anhydrase
MATARSFLATMLAVLLTAPAALADQAPARSADPARSLHELAAGNHRYFTGSYTHASALHRQRQSLTAHQKPTAVVVGCSDSRVPPELVFDQGLGSLFVIRTAGNAVDDAAIASIEYAVEHLGVGLVIVLGHEHCGAVEAALHEQEHAGKLGRLVNRLRPALVQVPYMPGDPVHNGVHENVVHVMAQLRATHPVLAPHIHDGRLAIVGGVYSFDTGRVTFMDHDGHAMQPRLRAEKALRTDAPSRRP